MLKRVDVNFLKMPGLLILVVVLLKFSSSGNNLAVYVLGVLLDGGIDLKEGLLGIEDLFNSGAEFRPNFFGEIEIGAEVEQGVLTDLFANSSGFDETVGEIGTAGAAGSCLGLTNEHEDQNKQVF